MAQSACGFSLRLVAARDHTVRPVSPTAVDTSLSSAPPADTGSTAADAAAVVKALPTDMYELRLVKRLPLLLLLLL